MGLPMARNLARAGFAVQAWNRSPDKAQPLAGDGATVHETPADAVDGAGAIVTMTADTDAVLEAIDGALERAADDAIWVQMSTIGLDGTERCAALAEERKIAFVDAPVLGTTQPAEKGELIVMASGPDTAKQRLAPLFDAIGKQTLWLGEAGAGSRLKLVANSWILTIVEGSAETIALADGLGVDPADFLGLVAGGPLDLPYLQMKGKAIIERDFDPAFRLSLAAKDAGLVKQAIDRHDLDLPILEAIERRLVEGIEEHGDKDMSATYLTSAPASGRG